jgi:NAD(P)H-quinone oxidoreductase subunit K
MADLTAFDQLQKDKILNPMTRNQVTQGLSENVILTTVDDLYNWAKLSSLWPASSNKTMCWVTELLFI